MKFKKGQSLIEILVATAVGVILIGSSSVLIGVSLKTYNGIQQHLQANFLLRQGIEITQSLARSNWHSIYDLTPGIHYKIAKRGNSYTFQKGEEKVFDDTGLVAYWNMDEATSTIAYDNSGNTNNGTLVNSPTWKSGSDCISGNCLSFDGSDDYVDCGNVPSLISDRFTAEAWIYPTSMTPIEGYGRTIMATSNGYGIWLLVNEGKIRIYAFSNSTAHYYQTVATPVSLNEWNHVVVTAIRNGDGKIYVNGNFIEGFTAYNDIGWQGVFGIGDLRFNRKIAFLGLIDEVRIYNRALSADEIANHYKAGLDKLGLVGYWAMDENGGATAYDNANSNNGTLYNSPTWKSSSDCISGSCLSFDGSSNYYVRSNNDMFLDSDQTYSVWVYPKSTSGLTGVLTTHNHANTSNIGINTYGNKFAISIGYTDGTREYMTKQSNYPIVTNTWIHVVLEYNNNENSVSFYINGVFDSKWNLTKTVKFAPERVLIGQWSNTYLNNYKFNGLIDEVRIYNRALSAEEINNRYQAGYTRYLTFNKVSRSSGNIENNYNPNNNDPSTFKTISTIKYGRGLVSNQGGGILNNVNYLTRSSNNQVFQQTDWSGGPGQTGPIPNPGDSFDSSDSNINYASTTGSIYMTTATTTAAGLTSSILDTGISGGAGFNSLLWQGSLGTGGAVKIQIAFSNAPSGPWTYYGPTSTSDWYQPNPNTSYILPTTGSSSPQNNRYIRYKVNLSTTGTSPQINDIIINWSP